MRLGRAAVRRFLLGFLVPLVFSLLASYVIYQFILASNDSLRAVSLSYQRISALNNLMSTVLNAETGMRGFVITGQETFLEPYNASLVNVSRELDELRRLLRNEESLEALSEIDQTFESWRREIAEVVIRSRRTFPIGLASNAVGAYTGFLEARRAEARYRQGASPEALIRWGEAVSDTQTALDALATFNLSGSLLVQSRQLSAAFDTYRARVTTPTRTPSPAEENAAEELTVLFQDLSRMSTAEEQKVISLLRTGAGKVRIDRIRAYVTSITRRAETTLQSDLESGASSVRLAQIVAFAGPLAGAILGLLALILSQRTLDRSAHRLTQFTEEVSAGHYDRRLRVIRGEELWQLTQNFNLMAGELGVREKQTHLLGQMGKMLQTCSDSDELYSITRHFAGELFYGFGGALYIINASRNMMQGHASWGGFADHHPDTPGTQSVHAPDACWAIRQGQTQLSRRGSSNHDIFCPHIPHPAPHESLCIPLVSQDETLGVFYLYSNQADMPLSYDVQRLATTVAENLALALSNLRLREKLRHQSIRDPLTGLFNRRHLEETLELELHRAARRGEPISLIMFDVDHFKSYNDTFGHDAGDSVLQRMSELVQNHIRAGDVACRYGGEEFLLVQPGMTAESAVERAENLRQAVAKMTLEHHGVVLKSITISIGIAVYPGSAENATALIKRADEALYQAKRGGRNRVVFATPHEERGSAQHQPDKMPG